MREIALGAFYPNISDYWDTWVAEQVIYNGDQRWADVLKKAPPQNQTTALNGESDRMPFSPSIQLENSQCFAGYNPTSAYGPGSIGRNAGTSGVFCSWLDYPALYKQECVTPGLYLCDAIYSCNTSINPVLLERFGAHLNPINNATGAVTAVCAWNPFDTRAYSVESVGDDNSVVQPSNFPPNASCVLAGPKNRNFDPYNCPAAAKGVMDYIIIDPEACEAGNLCLRKYYRKDVQGKNSNNLQFINYPTSNVRPYPDFDI